jgi:hypothetical protein
LFYKPHYQYASSSHHLACVYQDSFRSGISFLRYRAETKQASNFCSIFRSCDLDLCSTNLIINRLPPLTIRHRCIKFHLDPTFCYRAEMNQRLPGACNRSPGSKLLSITTQLHCGGHLGGRARLPDTFLEEDHPMTIPSKFGSN